jgi:hypothetical protein
MSSMPQPAVVPSLEELAREELAVHCPELLEDEVWIEARENLLRLFVLLEAFLTPDDAMPENSSCAAPR